MRDLYRGTLVCLAAHSVEELSKAQSKWDRDTEFHRLANTNPARPRSEKQLKERMNAASDKETSAFRFAIRALAGDALIGDVSLWVGTWNHADAWLGISIGERDYWDKGYGTDAMRLIVQYGFLELNLRRITLGLHSYNARALKSYEKAGFLIEGRMRGEGLRDGQRYDGIYMGVLREEWEAAPREP